MVKKILFLIISIVTISCGNEIVSLQYDRDVFSENEFVITIYWGIVAFIFLSYGIQKNLIGL